MKPNVTPQYDPRTAALLCALGLFFSPAKDAAAQQSSTPVRGDLLELLDAIDVVPTEAEVRALGGSAETFAAIAKDETRARYIRLRATAFLGYFPVEESGPALARLIDDPQVTDETIRIRAVATYGGLYQERALTHFRRWRALGTADVRAALFRAAARMRGSPARAFLVESAHLERDPSLRQVLDRIETQVE